MARLNLLASPQRTGLRSFSRTGLHVSVTQECVVIVSVHMTKGFCEFTNAGFDDKSALSCLSVESYSRRGIGPEAVKVAEGAASD